MSRQGPVHAGLAPFHFRAHVRLLSLTFGFCVLIVHRSLERFSSLMRAGRTSGHSYYLMCDSSAHWCVSSINGYNHTRCLCNSSEKGEGKGGKSEGAHTLHGSTVRRWWTPPHMRSVPLKGIHRLFSEAEQVRLIVARVGGIPLCTTLPLTLSGTGLKTSHD